jgi:trehalose-6-phosphate synthase
MCYSWCDNHIRSNLFTRRRVDYVVGLQHALLSAQLHCCRTPQARKKTGVLQHTSGTKKKQVCRSTLQARKKTGVLQHTSGTKKTGVLQDTSGTAGRG